MASIVVICGSLRRAAFAAASALRFEESWQMLRLRVLTAVGALGTLFGAGLTEERGRDARFGLLLFIAGVACLVAGIAGQAVVSAIRKGDL
jgi:hypothetical protein